MQPADQYERRERRQQQPEEHAKQAEEERPAACRNDRNALIRPALGVDSARVPRVLLHRQPGECGRGEEREPCDEPRRDDKAMAAAKKASAESRSSTEAESFAV